MNKLFYLLLLLISNNCFAQDYLITNKSWQEKIQANHQLAPLFYGVELNEKELKHQSNFIKQELSKYGSVESAFNEHYKLAWNYFNIGIIDTAIIAFNNAYLIDTNNENLIPSFGNLLCYVNENCAYINPPSRTEPNMELVKIFKHIESNKTRDLLFFFGDRQFANDLNQLHKANNPYTSLNEAINNIKSPYTLKSDGNIAVKLIQGQEEGYYKQGLKHGIWVNYFKNTAQVNYSYNTVDGLRDGVTTSYYKNGTRRSESHYADDILIKEQYYDKRGKVTPLEAWARMPNNSFAQNYLITNEAWQEKIKTNNQLAPLFYGIELDEQELKSQSDFVKQQLLKHGSVESAFNEHYKLAWNYFNVGIIDSAIIAFNNAYLINDKDKRIISSFGNLLCYVNENCIEIDFMSNTNSNMELDKIFRSKENKENWGLLVYFGDTKFSSDLNKLHKIHRSYSSLNEAINNIKPPYALNADGHIVIKLLQYQEEGYYKQGLQHGIWINYFENTAHIDYRYTMVDGVRHGATTSYYKDGTRKREFHYVNNQIIGEHKYYDENGKLIKIEVWREDGTKSKKILKNRHFKVLEKEK